MPTIHDLHAIPTNATDKGLPSHTFAGQSYLHVYERYFEPKRLTVQRLLEIGVLGGHSLRLWRDYFPNAYIHGFDIDPSLAGTDDRITVHTGDQYNTVHLALLATHGPFDIIIDDGSHISIHIATSFEALWPHVSPGGFYCIEDLRCTYDSADGSWPGMHYNATIPPCGDRFHIDNLLQRLITDLDNQRGDVRALHVHPMQLLIEKV